MYQCTLIPLWMVEAGSIVGNISAIMSYQLNLAGIGRDIGSLFVLLKISFVPFPRETEILTGSVWNDGMIACRIYIAMAPNSRKLCRTM